MPVGPLLYRPSPKWHVWAALGGAAAIHFAAAVIAGIHKEEAPMNLDDIPDAIVIAQFEQAPPEPEPTPPPEEPDVPPPPPPTVDQPEFKEEQPTPPPQKPKVPKPVAPIAKPRAPVGGSTSISSAKANAVFGPKPVYPYEARRSRVTGSGVCVMSVDTASGSVSAAVMAQSTGSSVLDNACITTFRRWRFKPGTTPPKVKVPITFTMSGASF